MRYFDDGDLTDGLQIANKAYPFDLVEGYWHAVSNVHNGERYTVDYDDEQSAAMFRVHLEAIDEKTAAPLARGKGRSKRAREETTDANIRLVLKFRDWHLEYVGTFNTEGPATIVYLTTNETPEVGEVDNEATIAFGCVIDDQGYPFMRVNTSGCEASSGADDMLDIEIVAKRTDTTQVSKLELSKNERLRLGYEVRSDGRFEDIIGLGEPTDSYEDLTRQLSEHTSATARIARQLTMIRAKMDEQLREAVESGTQVRNMYQDQKRNLQMARPAEAPEQPQQEQQPTTGQIARTPATVPRPSAAPRPSTANSNTQPPTSRRLTYPNRASNATRRTPRSAPAKMEKGKRYCAVCDKSVSLSHGAWDKHIKGRKHADMFKASGVRPDNFGVQKRNVSTPHQSKPPANANTSSSNKPRPGLQTRSSGPAGGTRHADKSQPRARGGMLSNNGGPSGVGEEEDRGDFSEMEEEVERDYDSLPDEQLQNLDAPTNGSSSPSPSSADSEPYRQAENGLPGDSEDQPLTSSSASTPVTDGIARNANGAPPSKRRRRRRLTSGGLPIGAAPGTIVVPGGGQGRFGGVKGATQLCTVCNSMISVKNWNVHTKSNKHRTNSQQQDINGDLSGPATAAATAARGGSAGDGSGLGTEATYTNGIGNRTPGPIENLINGVHGSISQILENTGYAHQSLANIGAEAAAAEAEKAGEEEDDLGEDEDGRPSKRPRLMTGLLDEE